LLFDFDNYILDSVYKPTWIASNVFRILALRTVRKIIDLTGKQTRVLWITSKLANHYLRGEGYWVNSSLHCFGLLEKIALTYKVLCIC